MYLALARSEFLYYSNICVCDLVSLSFCNPSFRHRSGGPLQMVENPRPGAVELVPEHIIDHSDRPSDSLGRV